MAAPSQAFLAMMCDVMIRAMIVAKTRSEGEADVLCCWWLQRAPRRGILAPPACPANAPASTTREAVTEISSSVRGRVGVAHGTRAHGTSGLHGKPRRGQAPGPAGTAKMGTAHSAVEKIGGRHEGRASYGSVRGSERKQRGGRRIWQREVDCKERGSSRGRSRGYTQRRLCALLGPSVFTHKISKASVPNSCSRPSQVWAGCRGFHHRAGNAGGCCSQVPNGGLWAAGGAAAAQPARGQLEGCSGVC